MTTLLVLADSCRLICPGSGIVSFAGRADLAGFLDSLPFPVTLWVEMTI